MSEINYFFTDDFLEFESRIKNIAQKKIIKKNSVISNINMHPHYSYYIARGLAKLSVYNEDGLEKTMCFFGKGSMYPIIIHDIPKVLENYLEFSTLTETEVYFFPSAKIKTFIPNNPDFSCACIDYYVRLSGLLLGRALLNLYDDSEKSVCSFLYLCHKNSVFSSNKDVVLSQSDIGKILGFSRVQVSRILSMLREKNIIKTNRNKIEVIDSGALKALCSEAVH